MTALWHLRVFVVLWAMALVALATLAWADEPDQTCEQQLVACQSLQRETQDYLAVCKDDETARYVGRVKMIEQQRQSQKVTPKPKAPGGK